MNVKKFIPSIVFYIWQENRRILNRIASIIIFLIFATIYFSYKYFMDGDSSADLINSTFGVSNRMQLGASIFVLLIFVSICSAVLMPRPLKVRQNPAYLRMLMIILTLVFANALASSAQSVLTDINHRFWVGLYFWAMIALALQMVVAFVFVKYTTWPVLHRLVLAGFGTLAFYSLNFSLASWYRSGAPEKQMISIVSCFFLLTVIFSIASSKYINPNRIALVLGAMLVGPIAVLAADSINVPVRADLSRFEHIEFASAPDIHIISVESLAPPVLVEQYLQVGSVAYDGSLDLPNVHRFKNAFATNVPTSFSLNSVMRLAQSDLSTEAWGYFAGRDASPLATVLRANGYYITTGFPSLYLGMQGPFVDSYLPNAALSKENNSLCMLAKAPTLTFYGYCQVGVSPPDPNLHSDWIGTVVNIITASERVGPQFTYHHFLQPIGHTSSDFLTGNELDEQRFREYFLTQSQDADELIEMLEDTFADELDNAVVILTGDHGLWLSRTVSITEQAEFFVQDRHGIVLATLHNTTQCTPTALSHYMTEYSTPERLIGGVVRCLAKNPEQVDEALDFSEPIQFDQFRYE